MNSKEERYLKLQNASGLKVGDKVKVTRAAKDFEKGWSDFWISPDMDKFIGKIVTISKINGTFGINFKETDYNFPFFVLEKVKINE